MKAENLTPKNVTDLQEVMKEISKTNPELKYQFYDMNEEIDYTETEITLGSVLTAINELKAKIDLIFGDAVLIDGKFKHI